MGEVIKRKLLIDFDSERDSQIFISSDSSVPTPILDMGILCEALCTLIHALHKENVKKDSDSIKDCINHIKKGFIDESYKAYMTNKKDNI